MTDSRIDDLIQIAEAPAIPGLRFRHFRGDTDFPRMEAIIRATMQADEIDGVPDTAEQIRRNYEHLYNSDAHNDMVFIELDGASNEGVVGYSRVMWWQVTATSERVYVSFCHLMPEARRKGIGTALLKHNQRRLREIAAEHPRDGERNFGSWASDNERGSKALLERDGYKAITYGAQMVRPNLEDIPEVTLPEGIEIRPVKEEHLRQIWEADVEAFRDHWGFAEPDENAFQNFLDFPHTDHSLWRVAWQGDQVVGMVRSFINEHENQELNRKRGYTEFISTRRPWRRMGIARTLLCMSLQALKDRGMKDATLSVHVENPNGAFKLYESVGFRVTRINGEYRKPME